MLRCTCTTLQWREVQFREVPTRVSRNAEARQRHFQARHRAQSNGEARTHMRALRTALPSPKQLQQRKGKTSVLVAPMSRAARAFNIAGSEANASPLLRIVPARPRASIASIFSFEGGRRDGEEV